MIVIIKLFIYNKIKINRTVRQNAFKTIATCIKKLEENSEQMVIKNHNNN